jgi:tetratricopeptide (TPR) repeat protein
MGKEVRIFSPSLHVMIAGNELVMETIQCRTLPIDGLDFIYPTWQEIRVEALPSDAHNNYGVRLFNKNMFNEAVIEFDNALKIYPNANAFYLKGEALIRLDSPAEALECFEKVLTFHKKDLQGMKALEGKAEALRKLGREKEARAAQDKADEFMAEYSEHHIVGGS